MELREPLFHLNAFVFFQQGMEVARATKTWSGFLRETFGKADTF